MPSSIRVNHKKHWCEFKEEPHTYHIYPLGERPTCPEDEAFSSAISVTTLVHQFTAPFDAERVAKAKAEREGGDWRELVKAWDANRERACRLGTRTHETAEDCLLGRSPRNMPEDEDERARFRAVWNFAKDKLYAGFKRIEVEKLVFSPALQVAGSVDFLGMANAKWYVLDWKSNADLKKPAFDHLLHPFEHVPNDPLHVYGLQLAIYRTILKLEGYCAGEFGAARALWVRKSDDGSYAVEPVELPDMTAEGNLMLALVQQTPWWQESLKSLPF